VSRFFAIWLVYFSLWIGGCPLVRIAPENYFPNPNQKQAFGENFCQFFGKISQHIEIK